MKTRLFDFERDGHVGLLTLNNPVRVNPLGEELQHALLEFLFALGEDKGIHALVITGAGCGFCVGADLASVVIGDDDPEVRGARLAQSLMDCSNTLILPAALPFPVLSAVNGACADGGVGLALATDVLVMARSAYFYLPFMPKLGIVPDLGRSWFLERLIGRGRATALTLLGERLGAEQTVQWGLVWSCVKDISLRTEALALAHRLARLPAHAALETRHIYDSATSNSLDAQLRQEVQSQARLMAEPAFVEGVQAFMAKRKPRFPGR
ncbi:MAG: enoyl-CoA hydratase [Polaromonas sp.]|nr:enoyl-CoA hydratase [Polaromonas sp.]